MNEFLPTLGAFALGGVIGVWFCFVWMWERGYRAGFLEGMRTMRARYVGRSPRAIVASLDESATGRQKELIR